MTPALLLIVPTPIWLALYFNLGTYWASYDLLQLSTVDPSLSALTEIDWVVYAGLRGAVWLSLPNIVVMLIGTTYRALRSEKVS